MTTDTTMTALIQRLRATTGAGEDDLRALEALPFTLRHFRENQAVLSDSDRPSECGLIVEGFCVRSKTIEDGKRQILSIHIPGDLPDLQNLHLATMDHDLVALSNCTLAFIAQSAIRDLIRARPTVVPAGRDRLAVTGRGSRRAGPRRRDREADHPAGGTGT